MGVSDRIGQRMDEAADTLRWMHAYTYSGHPVGCAVALANLDILEREGLLERARELGPLLLNGLKTLESHPKVGEIRGIGYMAAIEFVEDRQTKASFPPEQQIGRRVHAATRERGMFTRLRGDVYNFGPCYVATPEQLDRMVQIMADSISATCA
jgi:adenosylmethionine-8-amino-7-oxononanoate aminotransferase